MSDYKLVPVRPTPEMCHAAEAALDDDQSWPAIWEEILDVAPDVQGELDVSALVEALELARADLQEWMTSFPDALHDPTVKNIERIDAAIDAAMAGGDQ